MAGHALQGLLEALQGCRQSGLLLWTR